MPTTDAIRHLADSVLSPPPELLSDATLLQRAALAWRTHGEANQGGFCRYCDRRWPCEPRQLAHAVLAVLAVDRHTAVDLSLLMWAHRIRSTTPCRVCGSTDMRISSAGDGCVTYRCGVASDALVGLHGKPYDEVAASHYRPSEQRLTYQGDPAVLAVVAELRALRQTMGEDMTVLVGTVVYPQGHGKHRCYQRLVHAGNDVWNSEYDFDYTHDPTHATQDSPADGAP